jgi:hypothetical protein
MLMPVFTGIFVSAINFCHIKVKNTTPSYWFNTTFELLIQSAVLYMYTLF